MDQERYADLKLGEKGAIISIIAYIGLSILKLFVGHIAGSDALRADGLNNATDIVASVTVLIGLKLSQRPADKDHPYGHWKAETVASLVTSFIIMAVGIHVLYEAIHAFFAGKSEAPNLISVWTGMFCAVIMYFVYKYNKKLADKIKSQAVMAAAKDNLSDAWVSFGTVIGIVGAQFNLPWLDPVTAILIGLLICKTAWDIFREASHHLTDGYDEKKLLAYKHVVLSVPGVRGVKDIRARKYGSNSVVDIILFVKSNLDIVDAHDISTKVEKELIKNHNVYAVHVHVEPKD